MYTKFNKFKFNSQLCTSIEQSRRLLELGLKKETADMNYARLFPEDDWVKFLGLPIGFDETSYEYLLPAWSLGRLWEIYWSNKKERDCLFGCRKLGNPYEKMIAMIKYDIEDGTFDKDYLEK